MKKSQVIKVLGITLVACICIIVGMAMYAKMGTSNEGSNDKNNIVKEFFQKVTGSQEEGKSENIGENDESEEAGKDGENQNVSGQSHVEEAPKPVTPETIKDKAEGTYEKWLASAVVIAVSMNYSDFEIQGIYCPSETEMSEKMDSEGVIVAIKESGKQKYIVSKPVEGEIKEKGARTLYSQDIEYATFEEKTKKPSGLDGYKVMEMKDLDEIISQSLLVSIYEN